MESGHKSTFFYNTDLKTSVNCIIFLKNQHIFKYFGKNNKNCIMEERTESRKELY